MSITNIWLADDDEDDCMVFGDMLSETYEQVALTCIGNGVDLLNRLNGAQTLPDLILLDVNMPLKSGMQCLKEIKNNDRLATVPIVVWSTACTNEMIKEAYHLGARLYIRKPHSFERLKTVVSSTLSLDLMAKESYDNFIAVTEKA